MCGSDGRSLIRWDSERVSGVVIESVSEGASDLLDQWLSEPPGWREGEESSNQ